MAKKSRVEQDCAVHDLGLEGGVCTCECTHQCTKSSGTWLIRNDGVELELVGGPYTAKQLRAALKKAVESPNNREETTYHTLEMASGKPVFGEFSGGEMDELRAGGD